MRSLLNVSSNTLCYVVGGKRGRNADNVFVGIPIGRLGYPAEVAETVVWMVKTGYVTNKVIGVDGGFFVQ